MESVGETVGSELARDHATLRAGVVLLQRIGNLVEASLGLESTCYAVLTGVTAGVGLELERAMLFEIDPADRGTLVRIGSVGPSDRREADRVWRTLGRSTDEFEDLRAASVRSALRWSTSEQRVRRPIARSSGENVLAMALWRGTVVAGEGTDDLGLDLDLATGVAAPLRDGRTVCGVLYADNRRSGKKLDPVRQLVFGLIADQAGRAIANARRFAHLAREARTDSLTGLGHHGSLMADLEEMLPRSLALGEPVGLAMVDLDGLKHINDSRGHLAGDALLVGVAERMHEVVRRREAPYRYGGDEFAVAIPGGDLEIAVAVGERIRDAISRRPFDVGSGRSVHITCSVGVASAHDESCTVSGLVAAADGALGRAKTRGKNRVVPAGDDSMC